MDNAPNQPTEEQMEQVARISRAYLRRDRSSPDGKPEFSEFMDYRYAPASRAFDGGVA